jgi:hypothetical protein
MIDMIFYCPQCSYETPELYEGYCKDCCVENQRALDEYNFQRDFWNHLTDEERKESIRYEMNRIDYDF